MKKNKERKSVFDTIINIFAWLSFSLAILMALTAIFASFSDEQNGKEVFGSKMLIVSSDSMSKSPLSENEEIYFETGDVIIIKTNVDVSSLKEGDVITFVSYDKDSYGKTITHKIREIKYSVNGNLLGFVTYGINTGVNDKTLVQPDSIIGVYSRKIPNLGNIFAFLKTPRGYFMSILTPCVLLIIFFSMKVGKAVGQKKVLVEYDEELDTLKKRVDELEKQIQEKQNEDTETQTTEIVKEETTTVDETPPIVAPIIETTVENTVTDYSAINETNESINRLEINGTKTSFAKKVLSLDKEVQDYFNLLHNELISYKKVKARLSFKCMSYRLGRKLLAKISVRGKTLTAHFALDVNAFDYNVYFQKDMGDKKAFEEVPFTVKVKSNRGADKAVRLIGELANLNELKKLDDYQSVNALDLLKAFENEVINTQTEETAEIIETNDKLIINGKKVSFAEKILGLDKEVQDYFSAIHNELISYKKVSARLSFKCMSYRTGRKLLAKISVRGKTLNMYLALNPLDFNQNVYHQKDVGEVKSYQLVPFRVKVKSDRGSKNAIKLINELGVINSLIKNEKFAPVNVIKLLKPLENEIAIAEFNEDDKLLVINAKKVSFTEKLERLTEEVKGYYAEIREEFTSYKKVSERVSQKCVSYRTGRKLLAKISVRGKTLTMHFALDVNEFNKNVYFQRDMSDKKAYSEVPFTIKVKSNRAKRNALKLIKELMEKNQVIKINK